MTPSCWFLLQTDRLSSIASQVALVVKKKKKNHLPMQLDIRDTGSIPESGRSPGEGHGNPLQYSCPGNLTDRGAWWAAVHSIAESNTTEATESPRMPGMPDRLRVGGCLEQQKWMCT